MAGVPGPPTYADAYLIDAGVCLLAASNGQVRLTEATGTYSCFPSPLQCRSAAALGREHPTSMTSPVTARRPSRVRFACWHTMHRASSSSSALSLSPPHPGDPRCGSCTPTVAFGFPNCAFCPTVQDTPCGEGASPPRGFCDEFVGCICYSPFARDAAGNCVSCAADFYGPTCSACPDCGTHGTCDGSGTNGGSGTCDCSDGWSGPLCATPPPATPSPAPPAPNGGAIAAGVVVGALGAAVLGVFVYARFFGGGPAVSRAWEASLQTARGVWGSVTGGAAGSSVERASLLQPKAAAERLAPATGGGGPN